MAMTTHDQIRDRSGDKRIMNDKRLPPGRRYINAVYWVVGILLIGLLLGLALYRSQL